MSRSNLTIQPSQFEETVWGWLNEYDSDAQKAMSKAVLETAEESKQDLTGAGGFNGTKFKKSWKVNTTEGKLGTVSAQVGNKIYRITHLLEFGHAKSGGGRVQGYNFVAPVNDKVEDRVINKIKEALGK